MNNFGQNYKRLRSGTSKMLKSPRRQQEPRSLPQAVASPETRLQKPTQRPATKLVQSFELNLFPNVCELELSLENFLIDVDHKDLLVVIDQISNESSSDEVGALGWPKSAALGRPFCYLPDVKNTESVDLPVLKFGNGGVAHLKIGIYQWQKDLSGIKKIFKTLSTRGIVKSGNDQLGMLRKRIEW